MQFGITLKPDISVERIVASDPPGRRLPDSNTAGSSIPTYCGRSRYPLLT